jgi:hypothetical protein
MWEDEQQIGTKRHDWCSLNNIRLKKKGISASYLLPKHHWQVLDGLVDVTL